MKVYIVEVGMYYEGYNDIFVFKDLEKAKEFAFEKAKEYVKKERNYKVEENKYGNILSINNDLYYIDVFEKKVI
jgi:hypothetical protein